jgi:predicted dehydrogenase
MKTCKVAFVGAGYMATEHMKAFSGIEGVELVGVFSRTRDRAKKLAANYVGMKVCDSVAELYRQTSADLVVVTVKELFMNVIATECFAYPWKVLLEKPSGYNLPDATAILEAARHNNSSVYVALNRRTYSSTTLALSRLESNSSPRFIKVQDQQDQNAALNIYNEPPLVAENYMYANSIHMIDYLRVFGRGEIAKVTPVVAWDPKAPGIVIAHIEFSSGDIGLYEGIWNGPGPWAVTVNTPQERLEMRPLEHLSVQIKGERKSNQIPTDTVDTEFKPGILKQALAAVAAVNGKPSSLGTLEDAYESMQLVAKIFGHA